MYNQFMMHGQKNIKDKIMSSPYTPLIHTGGTS